MIRAKQVASWAIRILVSTGFILASVGKLTKSDRVIQRFHDWGYFDGFYLFIGAVELSFAILLLIPRTSVYSAYVLIILMVGAMATHLLHDSPIQLLRPGVFMLFLVVTVCLQRNLQTRRADNVATSAIPVAEITRSKVPAAPQSSKAHKTK